MTRIEKYAVKRANIEYQNMIYMFKNYQEYFNLLANQKKIKAEKGCKH